MILAMGHLLRLAMIFLRCFPAFFRSQNEQALIELAIRQQLATYTQRGSKPRITPLDRAFWAFLSRMRISRISHIDVVSKQIFIVRIRDKRLPKRV